MKELLKKINREPIFTLVMLGVGFVAGFLLGAMGYGIYSGIDGYFHGELFAAASLSIGLLGAVFAALIRPLIVFIRTNLPTSKVAGFETFRRLLIDIVMILEVIFLLSALGGIIAVLVLEWRMPYLTLCPVLGFAILQIVILIVIAIAALSYNKGIMLEKINENTSVNSDEEIE